MIKIIKEFDNYVKTTPPVKSAPATEENLKKMAEYLKIKSPSKPKKND